MAAIAPFTTVRKYGNLVGVCITPGAAAPKPFHIAFVLDTSGSMEGDRLATVQRTLRLFAEELQSEDRVSILSYSNTATLVCAAGGKEDLLEAVAALHACGGTNLEAGIGALLQLDLSSVDAVFLLTDGEVNQGISSVKGLESLVREIAFRRHAIPVHTLGYGEDHNAHLLQAMAVATRSSYTYADSAEMIPSVVGSILVAMREEVAKAVTLEWEGHPVVCREFGHVAGSNTFVVGSLIAHKTQWALLKGAVDALRIRVGESVASLYIPWDCEDVAVLEQDFRIRCAELLGSIEEQGPLVLLPKLQKLEEDIRASPVHNGLLGIRILAEIAEQRARLDAGLHRRLGTHDQGYAPRTASHMTAFATQRGDDCFSSPTQRQISQQMVHSFNQDPC